MVRILCLCCIAALVCLGQAGADHHRDGHRLVRDKLHQPGRHRLHSDRQGHEAHAHVANGKVHRMTATHKGRALPVTKFKTAQRRHAMTDARGAWHLVMADAEANAATFFIGFGFLNQVTGQWIIFWFPVNLMQGGDAGCTDYDAMT
jgi:hypothetical protein